ncbi:NADH dehydrogenase subunit 6 (mitochondrion) [Macrobrachium nipponense]|uniref:NADH-ubiquinone oxidoreductase chain 6 n=1 Tax=Macrobrachium nipponense TaxID=159736 RepID=E7EL61_MACNP|nr:NADH dehydrogenase subunit 6 [Macrobrachium nipponense]ADV30212.1 NADH dehydrogenase subunit 6 [Macrobrachium nipponense]UVU21229.1 NADH dehydrogenase subunit 6 [Macrobrachium nipponense]
MNTLLLSSLILISTSICFMQMSHPLAMGLTLIFQTMMICVTAGLLSKFMWFSYILFLIFLGATLVLFIYVSSLASNETFKLSTSMTATFLVPLTLLPILPLLDQMITPTKDLTELSFMSMIQETQSTQMLLSNMYNPTTAALTGMVILYLLLTLIVVVKLTSTFSGPLRTS